MALGNQSSTDSYELLDLSVRKDPTDLHTSNQYNNNKYNKNTLENLGDHTKNYEKSTSNRNIQSEDNSSSTDTADELSQNPNYTNKNCYVKYDASEKLPIYEQTPLNDESVLDSGFSQNSVPMLSLNKAPILESSAPNYNKKAVEYRNPNDQVQGESRIKLILPPKKRPRDLSMFAEDTDKKPIVTNSVQDGSKRNENLKGKYIKPPCKCVFKCYRKINYNERLYISQQFGALTDKQAQLDFLLSHTEKFQKFPNKVQDAENKRLFVFKYKLPIPSQDRAVKVCKKMFLNTLMISAKLVKTAWNSIESAKELMKTKKRHHKIQDKVIVKTMVKSVRDHVNSFTPIGSQYLGENITKLYLDGSLSISRMFDLYNEWIDPNKYVRRVKTEKQYRDLVKKNIVSGLHIPNNDQYNQTDCLIQNDSSTTVTENTNCNTSEVCEDDEKNELCTNNVTSVTCLADYKEHDFRDNDQPSIKELQHGTETKLISFNHYSEYHNHSVTSSDIKCNCVKTVESSLKDNLNDLEQRNSEVRTVATSPLFTSTTPTTEIINVADIPLPPEKLEENISENNNSSSLLHRKIKKSSKKYSLTRYNDNLSDSTERPCACISKCSEKISNNERRRIYKKYRDIGDKQKQFDYIITFTEKQQKKRWINHDTTNDLHFKFKYKLPTSRGPTVDVCKRMFMNTLLINDNTVKTAWEKFEEDLKNTTPDKKVDPKNMCNIFKTMVKSVRDHVNSFVPIETHFLGRKSNKLYLDGSLNIPRMFKLYNEWLDPNKYVRSVKTERKYKQILAKHFSLGFYTIKKDECDQCQNFRKLSIPSDEQTARHIIHTQTIVTVHNKKNQDILEASVSNGKIISAIFDIEKLLPCPHGQESLFNNKRKLLCFNLPILDMSSKRPVCYMWDECVAKNGANEVSSCLFDFLNANIKEGVEEFRFWSENDESRNQSIFYVYVNVAFTNKVNIYHNFHVKDHVQSEVTSVHSVIDKVSSSKHIYKPEEWKLLVKWTRTNCQKPYKVIDMTQNDFYDFQSHVNALQWHKNIEGKTVAWNEVREVFISSDDPSKIKFRYDYNQEFEIIETGVYFQSLKISKAYNRMLPLCHAKYKDLMILCDSGVIPKEYVEFYKKLPHISDN